MNAFYLPLIYPDSSAANGKAKKKPPSSGGGRPGGGRPAGGRPGGRPGPPMKMKTVLVPTLYDIDLKVKKVHFLIQLQESFPFLIIVILIYNSCFTQGKLIGICGSVGSGKSSLLQCILAQVALILSSWSLMVP